MREVAFMLLGSILTCIVLSARQKAKVAQDNLEAVVQAAKAKRAEEK